MAKFPEPPGLSAIQGIPPVSFTLPAGTMVYRIFFSGGPYPMQWDAFRYFGPTSSRFDHHLLNAQGNAAVQNRGIMYLATEFQAIPTCLAEVFQGHRLIDRASKSPVLAAFVLEQPVTLLDLTGPFATAIGASMAINSGPRPRARRWSQQLYEAYPDIHGLLYASSMYGNAPAIALFERAMDAIPRHPEFHRLLQDPVLENMLTVTANLIGYELV